MFQLNKTSLRDLFMIALGTAIYAFGFVQFNMANHLAEGGVAGLTLIVYNLIGLDPSYTTLLINFPLFILGAKILGRKSMVLSIYGTLTMSAFIWLFQRIALTIDVNHDLLIASLLAGLCAGIGSGLVFRFGGTTGGTDIIARVVEKVFHAQIGKTLLLVDIVILLLSLTYINIQHMMYTLIASFVYSQVITIIENGGYQVRGMLIVSDFAPAIATKILDNLERGVTYLEGEGAYSGRSKKVIYVALNPTEVREAKQIIAQIDPDAFVSILNIDEVISSDFVINRKKIKI